MSQQERSRTWPPGEGPEFRVDDPDWQNPAGATATGAVPKLPDDFDRVIQNSEGKWWNPYPRTAPKRAGNEPDPPAYFETEEWAQEIRKVYDLNLTDRITEYDEQLEVFFAVYKEDILPKIKDQQNLGDLFTNLEKIYTTASLVFEFLDEDNRIREAGDQREMIMSINEARKHQATLKRDQQEQEHGELADLEDRRSKDGTDSEADSQISVCSKDMRKKMTIHKLSQALQEYIQCPNSPKWEEESMSMGRGNQVSRPISFRKYMIDLVEEKEKRWSQNQERDFSQILSELGKEVMEGLVTDWRRKYDAETATPLTDEMDTALIITLNRFAVQEKTNQREQDQVFTPPSEQQTHRGGAFRMVNEQSTETAGNNPAPPNAASAPTRTSSQNPQAESEAVIYANEMRRERRALAIYQALREYVEDPDNPKYQERQAGTVKMATTFRWYVLDYINVEDISQEREKEFTKLLEDLGEEVIVDLIKTWSERYDYKTGTPLTDTIDKMLRRLLSRFKKRITLVGHHSMRGGAPLTVQQPLFAPATSPMVNHELPRHTPPMLPAASNDRAQRNNSHQPPLAGFASAQPAPIDTNVQQLVAAIEKTNQDNFNTIANKLNEQQSFGSGIKLDNIRLWEYDGNPLEFQEWRMRYVPVYHNNGKLADNAKLIYLSQNLSKRAKDKCWPQGIQALNYQEAWQKVLETFNDELTLYGLCLDKIAQQPTPRDMNDIKGLRSLVNTTRQMTDKLNGLNYPPATYSTTTMVQFMEKIPMAIQIFVLDKLEQERWVKVPLKDMIDCLDRHCTRQEHTTNYLEFKTKNQTGTTHMPIQNITMTGLSQQRYQEGQGYGKCIFCNHQGGHNGHKWKNCPEVQSPEKRYDAFRELRLCIACGSSQHYRRNCQSERRCGEGACMGKHHQSLHEHYLNYQSQRTPPPPRSNNPQWDRRENFSGGGAQVNQEPQASYNQQEQSNAQPVPPGRRT